MFSCSKCGKSFTYNNNLKRHQRLSCNRSDLENSMGDSTFNTSQTWQVHQGGAHGSLKRKLSNPTVPDGEIKKPRDSLNEEYISCETCGVNIPKSLWTNHIQSKQHKCNMGITCEDGIILLQHAFKSRIASYRISGHGIEVNEFFATVDGKIKQLLRNALSTFTSIKVNLKLYGLYTLPSKDIEEVKSFNTRNKIISSSQNLSDILNEFMNILNVKATEFQERDSGWILIKLLYIDVNINKNSPFNASSYIPLPKDIELKKAVLNIKNKDQECFKWSILAALHPVNHKENGNQVNKYKEYENELNFKGINFPVALSDIPKFEELNNISVNVYMLEKQFKNGGYSYDIVGPVHFTSKRQVTHVNLLILDNDFGNTHYCLIKNLSRLVRSQISKHKCRKFLCDGCLLYFNSLEKLNVHQEHDCNHIRVSVPSDTKLKTDWFGKEVPENLLKFEDYHKKMEIPFTVYADFESLLCPISENTPSNFKNHADKETSFTRKYNSHEPYSFAYYIKCRYNDSLSKFKTYRGPDASKVFVESLETDLKNIYNKHLKNIIPMSNLTPEEELGFRNAERCHICERKFDNNDIRVRDHCHLTGAFRGASHQICNLNYKISNYIPIVMHNLSNYDAHLFIKQLAAKESTLDVIATNKERYISFSKLLLVDKTMKGNKPQNVFLKLKFIDSFRFMSLSLEELAENLNSDQYIEIRKYFPNENEFNLIKQKGVFPYSYVTDFGKLEVTELPPKEEFYNELKGTHITEEDYVRACNVWKVFNCKTLGDYSDVYLKSDVLLLSDVFENFRNICSNTYGLEPLRFLTAPSLSWGAMLKCTQIELELLTDIEMINLMKRGIRGGVSQCSKRSLDANNKFCPDYDCSKPTSFIAYLDATNLYGAAMSQALPVGGFRWLSDMEIQNLNLEDFSNESQMGLVLEIDLEYPTDLYRKHNDLPLCPEHLIPPNSKTKLAKLIPNLYDKEKYVIHHQNLKQCLKEGLKLKKIHRVLMFNQSAWLKKYIDLNTEMRNRTANKFDKTFFKLMNNAVFGKTMENVEKYVDVKLVTHWENKGRKPGAASLISKPNFKNCSIFTDNFVAIQMRRMSVTYNKPIYLGQAILDLSKYIMYDFFYGFLKKEYDDKVVLAYTDTDSLIVKIETENFYQDIVKHIDKFDTSNYKPDNPFGIPITKSVVGKMKDEFGGKIVLRFRGTGSKSYCVKTEDDLLKKAKGVKRYITKNKLTEEDYNSVALCETPQIYTEMLTFKSEKHNMYTQLVNKIALSAVDDKRQVITGSTDTYAWGYSSLHE